MHYKVEIETHAEHLEGVGEVFVARVYRGPKRWYGMVMTVRDLYRSCAYIELCDLIRRRYPKVAFDFIHTPA